MEKILLETVMRQAVQKRFLATRPHNLFGKQTQSGCAHSNNITLGHSRNKFAGKSSILLIAQSKNAPFNIFNFHSQQILMPR
jgi:hypothetical protein